MIEAKEDETFVWNFQKQSTVKDRNPKWFFRYFASIRELYFGNNKIFPFISISISFLYFLGDEPHSPVCRNCYPHFCAHFE